LEPRIEAAKKRDTDKMLGQLKEVGNSVLGESIISVSSSIPSLTCSTPGWFGMSTDNFKMTPNGEGGYSLNFVNNPSR